MKKLISNGIVFPLILVIAAVGFRVSHSKMVGEGKLGRSDVNAMYVDEIRRSKYF
jgi:hypothetical protein